MVNGSQFTVVWHVDDLKLSHKDPKVVTKMIRYLKGLYERLPNGEIKEMSVQRGSKLDYLGMKFDLSVKGEVSITMPHHVEKAIKEFPGKLRNKGLSSPNTDKLFEIRKEAKSLDPEHAATFHRVVALLLYVSKRARPDLAPAVPFLTTRVINPTEDDWKKLRNVIEYLRDTKDLALTLQVDKTKPDVWSVDAAYAVHADCRSHTGATYTMGKGSFMSISCKQKTMTKSSCEAELVAVDDVIGHILRLRHFLLAQGYKPAQTVVILQDNKSAILLEQNGIMSSTKRTKHINVKYYFIKSKIDSGEVVVHWYPGEKMVGDFFSKPLSGQKFVRFRKKIMNLKRSKAVDTAMQKSHKSEPKPKDPNDDCAMVSIGKGKQLTAGYWYKSPGKPAVYVSKPPKHPARKGPRRNRRKNDVKSGVKSVPEKVKAIGPHKKKR